MESTSVYPDMNAIKHIWNVQRTSVAALNPSPLSLAMFRAALKEKYFTTTAKSHSDFWSCPHSPHSHPHSVVVTQQLLEQFKWDVSDHPAYSPDIATSDFHLFPELKI
ncbi:hypothetical protein AVEN_243576-1 [Araneus ventricosus]|uniref:Histone-lysine N-methyltransferase SETMAR n=1 Tax=Araneus ventricosus TaxID=182803 RepID=A0A4Y2A4G4_ARAVE|nr:hypothetical protein AVEN_243576-1 [Araneus ventricosus]